LEDTGIDYMDWDSRAFGTSRHQTVKLYAPKRTIDVSKENDKGLGLHLVLAKALVPVRVLALALACTSCRVVYVYSRIDRMMQLLAEGQNQRGT
jgi:hypothetical protein